MKPQRLFPRGVRLFLALAVALPAVGGLAPRQALGDPEETPIPGISDACLTINDSFIAKITTLGLSGILPDIPNSGWVFIDPSQHFRSVTGEVVGQNSSAKVQYIDLPMIHDSHDFVFNIDVDPGQEGILSVANAPNPDDEEVDTVGELKPATEIHVEWETGIEPDTHSGEGLAFFPKWAWPSEGDRVFVNGSWVFDCGHPTEVGDEKRWKSEIHPIRAIASMRQQLHPLPGSGATPVQVTATDIYIHGRAGFANDDLFCGPDVILDPGEVVDPCAAEPHRAFDIADDYEFDICLPPLLFDKAVPKFVVEDGPGNTVTDPARAPDLDPDGDGVIFEDSTGPCASDPADPNPKFGPKMVSVRIPLADRSGVPHVNGTDVYARKIHVGWVFPPENPHHLKVTLNQMFLFDDFDTETADPFDITGGELTFFFMNLNLAPDEWRRLSDFDVATDYNGGVGCPSHDNTLEEFDDDGGCGEGNLDFAGLSYDFYIGNELPFTIRARGYDQDCLEDFTGDHLALLNPLTVLDLIHCNIGIGPADPLGACWPVAPPLDLDECDDNDSYGELAAPFGPPYGVGTHEVANGDGEFSLKFTIEEIPLTIEDSADLVLTKDCKPDGSALAGERFACTILVENPTGPGLPRDVIVHDTLLTDVADGKYILDEPTFTFGGLGGQTDPCITPENPMETIPGGKEFRCEIGTVPIGGKAIITMYITSLEGGDFNNYANVFSASTDGDPTNNSDNDSVHVTAVADLSLDKSDSEDPLVSGTTLTYTLALHNDGPSKAVNVLAQDLLPSGTSVVSVSGTGGASCVFGVPGDVSRPTTCAFATLAPSASATMTVVVTVLPGSHNVLHNDARVSSNVLDLDNSDNIASEATLIKVADLQVSKTAPSDVYKPSSTIQYAVAVVNIGPADAENVVVTDNLPDIKQAVYQFDTGGCSKSGLVLTCSLGTIPAGGSKSFNIYVTVKGSKGQVTNQASVVSSTFDPTTPNTSTRIVLIKGGIKVGAIVVSPDGALVGVVREVRENDIRVDRPRRVTDVYLPWEAIFDVTDQAVVLKRSVAEMPN
jgi:uncharacterized repeat protein (TIGR01451 family)